MRNPLPHWSSTLLWQCGWAALVVGLAVLSGRFVEDAARAHQRLLRAERAPQAITPLSGSEASGIVLPTARRVSRGAQACAPHLEVTAQDGAMALLALSAPCAVDQPVEITHAGVTFAVRMTAVQPLRVTVPALQQEADFVVTLPGGQSIAAQVTVPDLAAHRRFAVSWRGEAEVRLLDSQAIGLWGGQGDPGPGPDLAGQILTLGDSDLEHPLRAQIFTYPAREPAEVVMEIAANAETCGTKIIGQTVSSRLGQAERTDLSVDLAQCGERSAVIHLKNLDRDVKLAAR